jgi:hypothetical protein
VDGKQFKRLTPPLDEPLDKGGPCKPNGCLFGERCDATGTCRKESLDVSYRYPVWSPDGKTVYFTQLLWWVCSASSIRPCVYAAVRSASGGAMRTWNAPFNSCIADVPLAVSPVTNSLLVSRGSCVNFTSGLYEWITEPPAEKRLIAAYSNGTSSEYFDPEESAAWLPDGSGFLFVAQGKTKKVTIGPNRLRFYRQGIYRWTESAGVKLLYEPPEDGLDIQSLAISASGQAVVEVIRPTEVDDNSQLHLFDIQTGTLGEQLTTSGDNKLPSW